MILLKSMLFEVMTQIWLDDPKLVDGGNFDCNSFPAGPNVVDPDPDPSPPVIAPEGYHHERPKVKFQYQQQCQ